MNVINLYTQTPPSIHFVLLISISGGLFVTGERIRGGEEPAPLPHGEETPLIIAY